MNAELKPEILQWARERAKLSIEELAHKMGVSTPEVLKWEATGKILYSDAENLAEKTYTPFGFLLLDQPPKDELPIADFRRQGDLSAPSRASADLLEVLHDAQRRQSWYREHLMRNGAEPLPFVGRATATTPIRETAQDIRRTVGLGTAISSSVTRWEDAMRSSIEAAEDIGIIVLRTGFAGAYTHRKLSVEEFRGFALADRYAPLVFINGADASTAQMFTLVHEIAHIWLGESAVSNLEQTYATTQGIERYCNQVAAEVLVPEEEIASAWRKGTGARAEIERLSKVFRVSRIVVARRGRDLGFVSEQQYRSFYATEIKQSEKSTGGNYYLNEQYKNSRRLSVALILDARAGGTMYHDAMRLLGIKKESTFKKYAESLNVEW